MMETKKRKMDAQVHARSRLGTSVSKDLKHQSISVTNSQ